MPGRAALAASGAACCRSSSAMRRRSSRFACLWACASRRASASSARAVESCLGASAGAARACVVRAGAQLGVGAGRAVRADAWLASTAASAAWHAARCGVAPALAFQSLTAFTGRQLLEGVDSATDYIAVEDRWLVALYSACVTGAAAEHAGLPCLPGAVDTLVATPVTSTASEVVQSLPRELECPGRESSREDLLFRARWLSHGVRPVGASHLFVGVAYWLRSALFSRTR